MDEKKFLTINCYKNIQNYIIIILQQIAWFQHSVVIYRNFIKIWYDLIIIKTMLEKGEK